MKIDCVLGIVLARDLSKMAHYAVEIAKEVLKLINKEIGKDLKDHILKMSIFTRKMQANAILAFFKNDFMRANAVLNEIQKVVEFDHQTENAVFQQINDIGLIISLISISRDIRNIANSAVAVAQDLQAKYRPKDTYLREKTPEATDYLISMDDELKT
jgi:phosphate uptake regulator